MRFFISCLLLLLTFSPAVYGQDAQKDIPEEFFVEADGYARYCSETRELRAYYNCDCLGNAYLKKRIERPEADSGQIQLDIVSTCLDASEAAGVEYEQCLGDAPMLPMNQTPETYCTCFANTYARFMEKAKMAVSSKLITEMKTQAHITCADPTLAKRMNPDNTLTP